LGRDVHAEAGPRQPSGVPSPSGHRDIGAIAHI
jgi:hypothetical protein